MLELERNYPEELIKDPVVEAKLRTAEREADEILEKGKSEGNRIMDKARAEADRLRKKHPGTEGMEMASAHLEQQAQKVKRMLEEHKRMAQKCITEVVESEEHRRAVDLNIQATTEKLDNLIATYLAEYDALQNVAESEKKQIRILTRIKFYTKLKKFILELKDTLKEVRIMQESFALLGDMTTTINNLLNLDTRFNEKSAKKTVKMLVVYVRKMEKAMDKTTALLDTLFDDEGDQGNFFVRLWNKITRKKQPTAAVRLQQLKDDKTTQDVLAAARANVKTGGDDSSASSGGAVGGSSSISKSGSASSSNAGGSGIDGLSDRPEF